MNGYATLICMAIFLLMTPQIFAQKTTENHQFLYAVVELHQIENSEDYEVELKASQVINKRLRIPTKSEIVENGSTNFISFQITDDAQSMVDEVIINDPFNVAYEYSDEQGNLQQARVPQKSRSVLIRRPISASATTLRVQSGNNKRSNQSFNFKFR